MRARMLVDNSWFDLGLGYSDEIVFYKGETYDIVAHGDSLYQIDNGHGEVWWVQDDEVELVDEEPAVHGFLGGTHGLLQVEITRATNHPIYYVGLRNLENRSRMRMKTFGQDGYDNHVDALTWGRRLARTIGTVCMDLTGEDV